MLPLPLEDEDVHDDELAVGKLLGGFTSMTTDSTEDADAGLLKYESIFELCFLDTDAQSLFNGGPACPA